MKEKPNRVQRLAEKSNSACTIIRYFTYDKKEVFSS